MSNLHFGMEIEFAGITREFAAGIVASLFGTEPFHTDEVIDEYIVADDRQRLWKVVKDASIEAYRDLEQCELVTPILSIMDECTLLQVIRELYGGGARVNKSCGIHIHVDAAAFTPQAIINLVALIESNEKLIYKALGISKERLRYCKRINEDLVQMIKEQKPKTVADIQKLWYKESPYELVEGKYHSTRYHGLNLHSIYYNGTIEFRIFNGSLDSAEVMAYLHFALALCEKAISNKKAIIKNTRIENEKYTFRCFLLRLGLIGDEYKDCRRILLRNLDGDSAWKG